MLVTASFIQDILGFIMFLRDCVESSTAKKAPWIDSGRNVEHGSPGSPWMKGVIRLDRPS